MYKNDVFAFAFFSAAILSVRLSISPKAKIITGGTVTCCIAGIKSPNDSKVTRVCKAGKFRLGPIMVFFGAFIND